MPRSLVFPVLILLLMPGLAGCNKIQARIEMKKGNALYQTDEYRKALTQFKKGLELDPGATFAWRSVGLTALALYHPGDESPQNQQYAQDAIQGFEKYLADYPDDVKVREYLLATYVNAKKYDDALAFIERQERRHPDPKLETAKVRILIQKGRLDEAMQLAQKQTGPDQAEMLYSVGVSAWDKAYRDTTLDMAARTQMVENGLAALKQALDLKPDYFEAMVYYNLMFREKAKIETDATKRQEDLDQANQWMEKAKALRKKTQQASAATPSQGK
jgi:tetratricopeptide (TPR) repeat protein